jgi:hypothetical protein
MYRLLVRLIVLAFFVLPIGCKDTIESPDLDKIVFPSSNISYGNHVEPLFLNGCAFSGCHDSETKADGLSLETYQEALSTKPGTIIGRDTINSRLIWRIEGKFGLARMPLDRPALNSNQIAGLKKWILEGAQNN